MKRKNILAFALLMMISLVGGMTSCSNDEDFYYSDTPRLRLVGPTIWTNGSDSLAFSFVTYPSDTTEKVMMVDAQVMGYAADHDRTGTIEVVDSLTTANADMYSVPTTVTIPANQNKGSFAVVLKRNSQLTEKTVRLYIRVKASNDFQVGVNEENHLTFIWNDQLSRPSNWSDLEPYFGTYSNTKYRFMLQNSGGVTEFDTETTTWAQLMSFKIMFQNALDEYNAAHPGNPLTDENGNLVSFNY